MWKYSRTILISNARQYLTDRYMQLIASWGLRDIAYCTINMHDYVA